jgi:hypothetical protein
MRDTTKHVKTGTTRMMTNQGIALVVDGHRRAQDHSTNRSQLP